MSEYNTNNRGLASAVGEIRERVVRVGGKALGGVGGGAKQGGSERGFAVMPEEKRERKLQGRTTIIDSWRMH